MTSRKRILLVDRNATLLDHLAARCRGLGLEVFTAKDAASAAQLLEQNSPDVICLDDQVPGDQGLTLCEMVIASPDDVTCPVVVLVGGADRTAVAYTSEMCVYYLQKRPNLWRYLEPVLFELVDIPPSTTRSNDHGRGISGYVA